MVIYVCNVGGVGGCGFFVSGVVGVMFRCLLLLLGGGGVGGLEYLLSRLYLRCMLCGRFIVCCLNSGVVILCKLVCVVFFFGGGKYCLKCVVLYGSGEV